MKRALLRWVRLWDHREPANSIALVRIFVALVLLFDLSQVARFELIEPLWAPIQEGGFGPSTYSKPIAHFYRWFGANAGNAQLLFTLSAVSAFTLLLGLFSRTSALLLLLAYAQLGQLSPDADRGIDTLLRNVLLVLSLSPCGKTYSLDARLFQGRFVSHALYPAWGRYLVVVQLVILYFAAGVAKSASAWSYRGGYSALFTILQEPHYSTFDLSHSLLLSVYPLLQLASFSSVFWERAAIVVPLLLWLRKTRERGGALRTGVNRARLLELWVATGVLFHLSLALLMNLGIFPWGCLALYPAFARPELIARAAERCHRAWGRLSARVLPPRSEGSAPEAPGEKR